MLAASQNQPFSCDRNESILHLDFLFLELQARNSGHPEMSSKTKHMSLYKNMGHSFFFFNFFFNCSVR